MRVALMTSSTVIPALAFCQNAIRRNPKALHSPRRWMASDPPSATRGSGSSSSSSDRFTKFVTSSTVAAETTAAAPPLTPRAAVSTVVQCRIRNADDATNGYLHYYLLVQRGKEPNLGMWSLPGGKLERGESTLEGARRELDEETTWPPGSDPAASLLTSSRLRWYDGTLCATDSIGDGYHYVIAQCFAQLTIPEGGGCDDDAVVGPPRLEAADDAAAVGWFTREDMQDEEMRAAMTPGVVNVIDRAEELSSKGLLPVNN